MNESGVFELIGKDTYIRKECLASIMVRKELVMRKFGYWDSVRVSADNEFWERMVLFSDSQGVQIIDKVLVIPLRRETSLTMLADTRAFDGFKAPSRRDYMQFYRQWQRETQLKDMRMAFPLKERPFSAPLSLQVPYTDARRAMREATEKG